MVRSRLEALRLAESSSRRRYQRGMWSVVIRTGDITSVVADAVVNASNTQLKLGSGVSGALRRACGPGLQAELSQLGGVSVDAMAVTGAYDLTTTERILHVPTVSGRPEDVRRALDNVLRYCTEHRLRSVAIPALGTGSGGLAVTDFARLSVEALLQAEQPNESCSVIFVIREAAAYAALEGAFDSGDAFERG
jgi:O-acetyl-ADP-ribose deacetylase (regulator of RNase III)